MGEESLPATRATSEDVVERALTDRLLRVNTPLRIGSLMLWPIFWLVYGGTAPWWMIVVPGLIHAVAAGGFIALSDIYQRAPNRHSILGWHIRYMIMAALTGVSYGGGGALLVNLPDAEPRLVVCATLAVAAEIAPGRLYAPKAFLAFAAVNILLLAAGLAVQGSNVALAQSESEGTRNTMQAVLDNMGDGAALYAEDGTLLFHNAAFRRLLDLDEAMLDARPNVRDLVRFQVGRGDFAVNPTFEAAARESTTNVIVAGDGKP